MKKYRFQIVTICILILLGILTHVYFKQQTVDITNGNNILIAPPEIMDNAHRLCKSMWPGAEEIQNKCLYEQLEAGKKVYKNYITPYLINKEELDPAKAKEKEHLVKRCLNSGQLILFDNSFALDYVEVLKCCEYSFNVWGFEKASWYRYMPPPE